MTTLDHRDGGGSRSDHVDRDDDVIAPIARDALGQVIDHYRLAHSGCLLRRFQRSQIGFFEDIGMQSTPVDLDAE